MSSAHLKEYLHKDLLAYGFLIFSHLKKQVFPSLKDNLIVHEALKVAKQSLNIDLLCIFTYNETIQIQGQCQDKLYCVFNSASEIQKCKAINLCICIVIVNNKNKGVIYTVIKIQFLAIYNKKSFTMKDIIQKVQQYNQRANYQQKINRNLNFQQPKLIVQKKDNKPIEKKIKKEQHTIKENVNTKGKTEQKQKIKAKNIQAPLPRVKIGKQSKKIQQEIMKKQSNDIQELQHTDKNRKLQLQSQSQSQDLYIPNKTNLFSGSDKVESSKMQIENQGNYRQNMNLPCVGKDEKMQIQNEPTETKFKNAIIRQEDDDKQDDIFALMEKKVADNSRLQANSKKVQENSKKIYANKPLNNFNNTFRNPPPLQINSKQGTLFGFMNKK